MRTDDSNFQNLECEFQIVKLGNWNSDIFPTRRAHRFLSPNLYRSHWQGMTLQVHRLMRNDEKSFKTRLTLSFTSWTITTRKRLQFRVFCLLPDMPTSRRRHCRRWRHRDSSQSPARMKGSESFRFRHSRELFARRFAKIAIVFAKNYNKSVSQLKLSRGDTKNDLK